MPRRDWLRNLTSAIIGAALVLAVLAIGYGLGLEHWSKQNDIYYHHKEAAERQRQQTTQEIAQSCEGRAGPNLLSCLQQQIATHDREQATSQDLQAQQEMALWGLWVAIAAFFTAALTAVGVYLIWQTLNYTRIAANQAAQTVREARRATRVAVLGAREARKGAEAGQEANRIAARQFETGYKPWISVSVKGPFFERNVDLGRLKDDEVCREIGLCADMFVHNIGEMPATIEDFSVKILAGEKWPYVREQPHGWHPTVGIFHVLHRKESIHIDKTGIILTYDTPFPMELDAVRITEENRHRFTMNPPPIVGYVIYSSPLGRRYRHNFAFVGDPPWTPNFRRFGGSEYNREDPIDD